MIGVRNRRRESSRCSASPTKRSSSDAGMLAELTGGEKDAEATFQNGLAVKEESHHALQRVTVRRLTPSWSDNCRRADAAPCCNAEISVTTVATYTLRPRNLSEDGVVRLRHSSAAQQKLKRWQ